ncbi:MAG: hypothetical protein V3R25_06000 [Nitrosomonadaceae bacterium]
MTLTRVRFTPRRRNGKVTAAPVNCKEMEYVVPEANWLTAANIALKTFKKENKLWRYYDIVAANMRVLES